MKHFTVMYLAPVQVIKEWMAKPEDERKVAEETMKGEWDVWFESHKDAVLNTIGLGKSTRVTSDGITNEANSMMLSSYVQGESAEAVAEMFKNHPHLGIPGASIEIMEAKQVSGM